MIAVISPNPSIDKLFLVDEVRLGAIHRPEELVVTPGGKGLNVARAARTLGGDVLAIALLAGHAGRWIADGLLEQGVRTDITWATGETRTSLSAADPSSGRPTEFYERGEMPGPDTWEAYVARVSAGARGARWVPLSGSLPPGVPATASADLVERARAAGARSVVDQHGAALAAALGAAPDVIKVNANEARELTGQPEPSAAVAALHELLAGRRGAQGLGAPVAIVTGGEEGAFLADPEGAIWHGTVDTRGPFPTGSGDSFLGALLVGLEESGEDWTSSLALALGAAAANAELAGAALFDPRRARSLAEEARIERA
jgi:1-phosphofructokinase family hexose kinase